MTCGDGAPGCIALLAVRDDARYLPGSLHEPARPGRRGRRARRRLERRIRRSCSPLSRSSSSSSPPSATATRGTTRSTTGAWSRPSWAHEPDWLLGIDADERLERRFRRRAERVFVQRPPRRRQRLQRRVPRALGRPKRTSVPTASSARSPRPASSARSRARTSSTSAGCTATGRRSTTSDLPSGGPDHLPPAHAARHRPRARQERYERLDPLGGCRRSGTTT